MLSKFLANFLSPQPIEQEKPKENFDFQDEYKLAINLLEEINRIDLTTLEEKEWPSQKKMIAEAKNKIKEAIDLLQMASKAPSNVIW